MEGKVQAKYNYVAADVDKAEIKFRLDDTVTLSFNATHSFLKTTDYGTPSWEGKVRELDGRMLTLTGKEPNSYVYFALEGLPIEPSLPFYRKD